MRSSHVKEKPYSCSCGAAYTLKQSLLRHQVQHRADGGAQAEVGQREETALESVSHLKPTRGRPKRNGRSPETAGNDEDEGKQTMGQAKGKDQALRTVKTPTADVAGDVQHAVIYVRADDLSAVTSSPLLLPTDGSLEPELLEVVISDSAEQCIMVQGQQRVEELLILQEEGDGLCTVAQTVEINTA